MGTALVAPPTGRSGPEGGELIPGLIEPIPGLIGPIEGGPRPRGSACASDAPSAASSNAAKRASWFGWCARTRPLLCVLQRSRVKFGPPFGQFWGHALLFQQSHHTTETPTSCRC